MAGEAKVVVRTEHDHALTVDHRLVTLVVVESLVEGVEAEGLCRLRKRESAGFGEDVAAGRIVVAVDGKGVNIDGFRDLFVVEGLRVGGQVLSPFSQPGLLPGCLR
jgi:hypothetical protein